MNTPVGGATLALTSYVWCGAQPCQARNAASMPIREYYAEGEVLPGRTPTMLYYGLDQIGSVRRVFASSGASPAYAYDPYGAPLQAAAPLTDRGYAGMLTEPNSGLGLTLYRAYNPTTGRWLSRDPAGEATDQSLNLYAYVNANPINDNDLLGLCPNKNGKPGQNPNGPGGGGPGNATPPDNKPCYGGEQNSQRTGAIVGSAVGVAVEAPEIGTAAYSAYKGARIGAIIGELAGPETVPVGLIVGGAVGIGVYFYDRYTNGSVSDPVNKITGQCP